MSFDNSCNLGAEFRKMISLDAPVTTSKGRCMPSPLFDSFPLTADWSGAVHDGRMGRLRRDCTATPAVVLLTAIQIYPANTHLVAHSFNLRLVYGIKSLPLQITGHADVLFGNKIANGNKMQTPTPSRLVDFPQRTLGMQRITLELVCCRAHSSRQP